MNFLSLRCVGSVVGALDYRLGGCGPQALAAPWNAASSGTGDRTLVPCVGRQILNHWMTREVLPQQLLR